MQPLTRDTVPLSQRTSEGIALLLRSDIFSGRLKHGEPLRERSLAEQLKVSRTPVREALFTLHSEGLVELSPNRGAIVRTITAQEIVQIYSLRAVLEAYAAREAARSRTGEHIDALLDAQAKLQRVSRDGTVTEQALVDLDFHQIIADAAGSRMLQNIIGQVLAFTVSFRSNYAYSTERFQLVVDQHQGILQALREQDSDQAEQLMREHVECSKRYALAHFDDFQQVIVADPEE